MKKFDLIHTAILIVALFCGFSALQSTIDLLVLIATYTGYSRFAYQRPDLVGYLIRTGLSIAATIILIRNSRRYATRLLHNEVENPPEPPPTWGLDRRSLILTLFIGMGLYTVIQALPYAIQHLFELFQSKVSAIPVSEDKTSTASKFIIYELLRITVGTFLIYAAPTFTNYIEKKIAIRQGGVSQSR
jgi:hypothetical protein